MMVLIAVMVAMGGLVGISQLNHEEPKQRVIQGRQIVVQPEPQQVIIKKPEVQVFYE